MVPRQVNRSIVPIGRGRGPRVWCKRMREDRLPINLVLLAAAISFVLSVVLWFTDSRTEALFVGLWVPSILALGAFYFSSR